MFNLFKRQLNRVRVGQEGTTITGVVKRRTPLKRLELLLLASDSRPHSDFVLHLDNDLTRLRHSSAVMAHLS